LLSQTTIPGYDAGMARLEGLEMKAWRGFIGAQARVVPALDSELAREMGLNLSQYEVLLRLNDAPDHAIRMSDLAAQVVMSPSGITRAVDQLERRGYVERRVCSSDRRGFLASLTAEGKAQLRRASAVHVRGIRAHFTDKLTQEQLEQLATLLELVSTEVEAPPCDVAS
jgi:DNA-binding MarR family transcriptional regulator